MATSFVMDVVNHVDFTKWSLYMSAASIAFNPLVWNIVARREYKKKILTNLFRGNNLNACYFLASNIFAFGLLRDYLFKFAIERQATHPFFLTPWVQVPAWGFFLWGNVLVLTSTWRLGITGTFLGDYCGILMDEVVTGFPFNVSGAPMYWGATMSFLGTGLYYGKPAGVVLSFWVYLVYYVALKYEDPFTAEIYAKRDRERAAAESGKKQR